MPVSVYLKSGLFVVAAAAALFAAAGTVAIASFWASRDFGRRDDRLVRGARSGPSARAHAAGRQEVATLPDDLLALSVYALDRCRARPWSFPLERRRARLAARRLPVHGRCRLRLALWAMRVNRFFSSVIRIQTDRGQRDPTPSSAIPDTP